MAAKGVIRVFRPPRVVVQIKPKAFRPLLLALTDALVGRQPAKYLETFGGVVGRRELLWEHAGTGGLR